MEKIINKTDEIIKLPYYGGAKGQILQLHRDSAGNIISHILQQDDDIVVEDDRKQVPLPVTEHKDGNSNFQENLMNIQKAASELISLQQKIKLMDSRYTSEMDQALYVENLEKLGIAAQNLARIQKENVGIDNFRLLFDDPATTSDIRMQQPNGNVKQNDKDDEDDNVGEELDGNVEIQNKPPTIDDNDSINISSPENQSSIAEAKPVALAIAGEGGVAAAKPIATAIVGSGGLAIARPVATAIAGISPSEVSGLGFSIPSKQTIGSFSNVQLTSGDFTKKYGLTNMNRNNGGEMILVGPDYFIQEQQPVVEQKDTVFGENLAYSNLKQTAVSLNNGLPPLHIFWNSGIIPSPQLYQPTPI